MPAKMWRLRRVMLKRWGYCVGRMPRTAMPPTGLSTCLVRTMDKLLSALFLSFQVRNWVFLAFEAALKGYVLQLVYWFVKQLPNDGCLQSEAFKAMQDKLIISFDFCWEVMLCTCFVCSFLLCRYLKLIKGWAELRQLDHLYSLGN